MFSPLRLDIGWADLIAGALACCLPVRMVVRFQRRSRYQVPAHGMAVLSVRSGFDLYLQAAALPPGAEVLVSAVTIPDMVRLVELHGLVPVPLDIDPATLIPSAADLERAITPRTRAVLVAHLFGTINPLDTLGRICRARGLALIEDCAQAFVGTQWEGDPQATVTLFSFGAIKRATALGGGIAYVRDAALLAGMRSRHEAYPRQSRLAFFKRILKFAGLKLLSSRALYGLLLRALAAIGKRPEEALRGSVRGFPQANLLQALRHRPCAALHGLLLRRLARFRETALRRHVETTHGFEARIAADWAGPLAAQRTFWVHPLLSDRPGDIVATSLAAGFHATQSASSLIAVGDGTAYSPQAQRLLTRIVYLPCYPAIGAADRERLAAALNTQLRGR